MSDADDVIANSKQVGSTSTWNATPRDLRKKYDPDAQGQWGGNAIHSSAVELTQNLPSRSEFRDSNNPIDTMAGFLLNTDAHIHELLTIYVAVELGYKPAVDLLRSKAATSPLAAAAVAKIDGK